MEFSLLIPTLQAEKQLPCLLASMRKQTVCPAEVIVIDSSSLDRTAALALEAGCRVHTIPRGQFRHGRSRNLAASMATKDLIVFLTQDVLPADDQCLERLLKPLSERQASAAYARQIAYPDAPPPERFLREFNYPEQTQLRTLEDLPRLGIKTFMFSNVASAVQRKVLTSLGGFCNKVIMNEDMLFCSRLLRAGFTVAYQADAVVYHSHRYSLSTQFARYFDIGVFQSQSGTALAGAKVTSTGHRFAVEQLAYLARCRAWRWLPHTTAALGLKLAAYRLGQRHQLLPRCLKRRLSLHSTYWAKDFGHETDFDGMNQPESRLPDGSATATLSRPKQEA